MVIARWPLPSSAPESRPSLPAAWHRSAHRRAAIRRLEIHDQERHRTVGLGLQDEAAVEFQRRAEQRRQHDRLAEQLADRGRIIVLGQDVVERGAEPGQAAAQIERRSTSNGSTASSTGTADGARTGVSRGF
jgi:hypothetical protein